MVPVLIHRLQSDANLTDFGAQIIPFGQWELLQASSHALLTCVCMFLEFIQVLCPVLPWSQSSPQGVLVPSSGKCPSKPRSWW